VGPRFNLILAGRDLTRVEPAAQRLRTECGVQVTALQMDTSSLASVREAAARCRAMMHRGEVDAFQAILCNAGARIEAVNYTPDGYEETFATNHLGHFLLIELLIDCMAENVAIFFMPTSWIDACGGQAARLPQLHSTREPQRGRDSHAGCRSWFSGSLTGFSSWLLRRLGVTMGDVVFSGRSLGKIAADPDFANASGQYFQSNDGRLLRVRSSQMSYDEQRATRLWNDSRELVHLLPSEEPALLR
jgi:NAD(P)-dependent dehydrogenase (short-subunit alcohol dehydrogenase family)